MKSSALFAGSFDPPTLGHLDIIERAAKMFDRLVVGIAINSTKNALIPISERLALLKDLTNQFSNVEIISYKGLTAHFAKENNISCLIRSIRSAEDSLKEIDLARSNAHLAGIETLIFPAKETVAFISSTIVREIAYNKGNLSCFVPDIVAKHLQNLKL